MLNWLANLFSKPRIPAASSAETFPPVMAPAPVPPLYYLDVDDTGKLFLRFIHVTSSVHAANIRAQGLQPLNNVQASLLNYLSLVFPGHVGTNLLSKVTNDTNQRRSGLVNQRLQAVKNGVGTLSLLPLGATGYLRSAASNAVEDGGEVFRALREALNFHLALEVPAPYTDATPTVFVVRHYLVGIPPNLQLDGTGAEDHAVSLDLAVNTNFESEHWCTFGLEVELEVRAGYPAAHIDAEYPLDEYLQQVTRKVSPKAMLAVRAMLTEV